MVDRPKSNSGRKFIVRRFNWVISTVDGFSPLRRIFAAEGGTFYFSILKPTKFPKKIFSNEGVKYPLKVRFRSFKRLNIKMSQSVVQKNCLQSEFMSIFSQFMAKLLFSIFVKHPVEFELGHYLT